MPIHSKLITSKQWIAFTCIDQSVSLQASRAQKKEKNKGEEKDEK